MRGCYRVKCGQLPNGLRFYTQYDGGSSRELAVIVIKAGSFQDPPNRRGLAHLVEHVICAESETYNREAVNFFETRIVGGKINFSTSQTATVYGIADSVKKNHNRFLFKIYAEMISNPSIVTDILKSEKAAIHQEHFLMGDNVIPHLFELLYKIVYPKNSPVHFPIDGLMGHVRKAGLSDIRQFIKKYYIPHNAFVVFFGPKFKEVEAIILEELGEWTGVNFAYHQDVVGFKPLISTKRLVASYPGIHQYHTVIGFPTETYLSEDAEALDILARILSDRMYGELRDKNLDWNKGAYRMPVFTERSYMHGLFVFHFATMDREFSSNGRKIFNNQCKILCNDLVDKKELEAWVGYEIDYCFRDTFQRSPSSLMDMIIEAVSNGDIYLDHLHNRGERLLRLLKRNGRQKLREVARKYLSGHKATVILKPR